MAERGFYVVLERNQASGMFESVLHGDIHWSLTDALEAADYERQDNRERGRMESYEVFRLVDTEREVAAAAALDAAEESTRNGSSIASGDES